MRYIPKVLSYGALSLTWRLTVIPLVVTAGLTLLFATPVGAADGPLAWTTKAPPPPLPTGGASSVSNGRIYYLGGRQPYTTNHVWEYEPISEAWVRKADLPSTHDTLAAATAPDGKVFAFSGWSMTGGWYTANVAAYDPFTNTSSRRTPIPAARQAMAAATAGNGRIYVIGGTGDYGVYRALSAVDEYDPFYDTWRARKAMPTARWLLAAVGASNGKVYAIGGYDGRQAGSLGNGLYAVDGILATVEEYDPATDMWTTKASMPTPRVGLAAVATPDGRIYAIGGLRASDWRDPASCLNTVEVYDIATDTWSSETPLPTPRTNLMAAFVDGTIYAFGGYNLAGWQNIVEAATPGVAATDADGDGVADDADNCLVAANPDQTDTDGDGEGDACDADDDNDGVLDGDDAFPRSPGESLDTDGDGIGNNADVDNDNDGQLDVHETVCGSQPQDAASRSADLDADNVPDCVDPDDDGDGVEDAGDNCPVVANGDQVDLDGDGLGAACDASDVVNPYDNLRQLILQFMPKAGVANSLIVKLGHAEAAGLRGDARAKAGMINAFINAVKAQTGKGVSAAQAQMLIQVALAL